MAKKVMVNLDLNGNSLLNPVLNPLAMAPANVHPYYVYTSTDNADKGTVYVNVGSYAAPVWRACGSVVSVNGEIGAVVLTQDHVGDGEIYVRTHNDLTDELKTLIEGSAQRDEAVIDNSLRILASDYDTSHHFIEIDNQTAAAATVPVLLFSGNPGSSVGVVLSGVATPTDPLDAANKSYVDSVVAVSDAMVFKGTIGQGGTVQALPSTHEVGWTYRVVTAGTYAGQACEVGDLIICVADGSVAADADWTVAQTNIDGVVTGPSSATDGNVAEFDGATGKVIKNGHGIASSISNDSTTIPTTAAVNTALSGLIKTATGTIGTLETTVSVSYTGTFINAYAKQGNDIVVVDISIGQNSVTFTVASEPLTAVACYVVYA